MSYAHSVSVGPRFFRKAFNDYSDKYWAFAREVMQNSIDCGSSRIAVDIGGSADDGTRVVVENDGTPMDEDTLVGKLLSLGESGKDFRGAVGGFGTAKEILYFAHKNYKIESGRWHVEGSGAGYDLGPAEAFVDGTRSTVVWDGPRADTLRAMFTRFVELAGTGDRVRYEIDGRVVRPKLRPGDVERTLDHEGAPWSEVRLCRTEPGLLVARVGGVPMFTPMFTSRCDYKGTVVLELVGNSAGTLTSNRDALKYPYGERLREFITTIAVDKRTAFRLETPAYTQYAGRKLRRPQGDAQARPAPAVGPGAAPAGPPEPMGGAGIIAQARGRVESPEVGLLGHEFIVKNCVRRPVPRGFDPGCPAFSDHARWLVRAWAGCLLELHDLHQADHVFSVGFVISGDCVAQYEEGEYGAVYFLNPCQVSKGSSRRRFNKGKRFEILAAAAHEFVHGGLNEGYHGEDFASKLTEVMSTVMKHGRRFTRHLR